MPRPRSARWSPHALVRLFRRPWAWWSLVAVLAATTAWFVTDLSADARRTLDRYGRSRSVVVATTDILPGDELGAANSTVTEWPAGLVPDGAVATGAADGAVVSRPVGRGEVVTSARLGGAVPDGTAGLALAPGPAVPPLEPGDRVDVVVTTDPLAPLDADAGGVVARDVAVLAVDDDQVTVAVPRGRLGEIARATALGAVTVALVAGSPG